MVTLPGRARRAVPVGALMGVICVLTIGLSACGSGATGAPTPIPSQSAAVVTRQLTQAQLDAALLPASDFPAGLAPQPIVSDTKDFYSSQCPYFTQVGSPLPQVLSSRDYEGSAQSGTPTRVYITAIEQYPSTALAQQAYDDLVKSYQSCATWKAAGDNTEVHVSAVSGPSVGQSSTYYKSGVAGASQTLVGVSLDGLALVDATVVDPAFGADTSQAPPPVADLLQKQVAKYLTAAG
jgi:hypothetical protein